MKKIYYLFICLLLFSSCATLYSGRRDYVHIASYPQGAAVRINGRDAGQTPLTLNVTRSLTRKNVSLQLPGYPEREFALRRKLNPWFILDAPTIIGGVTDIASGTLLRYRPHFYEIPLGDSINRAQHYSLSNNFFIQDNAGKVVYCKPSEYLGGLESLETMEGKPVKLKKRDIYSFKIIKRETYGIVLLKFHTRFYETVYERHPLNPEKPGRNEVFMQMLLKNGEYRLVMLAKDRIGISMDGGVTTSGSTHKYFLYRDKTFLKEIDRGNYKEELLLYFRNYPDVAGQLRNGKLPYRNLRKLARNHKMMYWD